MADTVSELLPCPFCGGKAAVDRADTLWAVACDDEAEANCLSGVTWGRYATRAAAIAAWNTRASTHPAPAFPREEVAKLIEKIRAAVTYQYMPMSVRMLLSQADSALSTLSPANERLREALARMVYEATHLSPCKPNGDHDCTIKADALAMARAALLQGKQP